MSVGLVGRVCRMSLNKWLNQLLISSLGQCLTKTTRKDLFCHTFQSLQFTLTRKVFVESILATVCSGSSLFLSYLGITATKLAIAYLISHIELILLSRSDFLKGCTISGSLKIENINLKEIFQIGTIKSIFSNHPYPKVKKGWKEC